MIEFLNQLDTNLFLTLNGVHNRFFDHFMILFTGRFIWIPMYASIAVILTRIYRWRQALIYIAAISLAIFLTDQTCATIIRPMVERLRPSNLDNALSAYTYIVDNYRGGNFGFPSCHSANSFALATFLTLMIPHRRFRWFILCWALLNSYSRLYLGVHYPGDLLVGAVIGSGLGAICYFLSGWFDSMSRNELTKRLNRPIINRDVTTDRNSVINRIARITTPDITIITGAATIAYITIKALTA